ncbi:hypothetical protein FRC00_001361 [Tulasnella sp. 408]|nr:hypothetical protein FRC00_001361 [Tulasnella sp. 408]
MSIAVLDLRSQVQVELSSSNLQDVEKLTELYVNEHRVLKKSQGKDKTDPVTLSVRTRFDTLMSHSAIRFRHFDNKNRPRQYRRYITALLTESEVQKVYLPMLLQYASVRRVRKHVQDFYQDRDGTISIFWNSFGMEVLQKNSTVDDDETYQQQLKLVARDSILKQLSAPYKRLVQSGGIPRGVAREAMLSFLGVVSRYLGDDADEDEDVAALKALLGPAQSDEEYEPSSESETDSEPSQRKSKKGGSSAKKTAKHANSSKNKGKSRSLQAENRTASDDKKGAPPLKPSKTRVAVSTEQGENGSANQSSVQRAADEDAAPPARKSVKKSRPTEPQGQTRASKQTHAEGSFISSNRQQRGSQFADRSKESRVRFWRDYNEQPAVGYQRETGPSTVAERKRERIRFAPRGIVTERKREHIRTTAKSTAGARQGRNVERTDLSQRLARSPSWDEEIDVNDPDSQASANEGSADLRSNEPGPSRVHSRISLPSGGQSQTRIRNPFINLTKMKEFEQTARPVKTKVSNPFAIKSNPREDHNSLDPLQPSSSTSGPSLIRKRSVNLDDDSDVEEIGVLPAGKKTRVVQKEKKNVDRFFFSIEPPTKTYLQPAMLNENTEIQPSDVGELHPGLQDMGNSRQSGRQTLNLPEATESALRRHILERATPLTTAFLQRISRAPTLKSAFQELRRKSNITWREETVSVDDPLLIWDAPAHYLDYICIVGSDIGFDPIILPRGGHQGTLTCKLGMAARPMRDKHIPITWDVRGRTYFVGFFEGKQVWLLFQPDDVEGVEHDASSTTTSLSLLRRRRFSLLWAGLLENLPKTNIVVRNQYADCTSDEAYHLASNLQERGTDDPQLSQHTLGMLQCAFTERYMTWAAQAPWRDEDPFFVQSTPTLVVNQYGQNQKIFAHGANNDGEEDDNAELNAFSRVFNWSAVGQFTYAIATTIRARLATGFVATFEAEETWPLYSTPDIDTREEVPNYEVVEAVKQGRFPEVFDEDGNRVDCNKPVYSEHSDCGILLDLDQVPRQIRAAEDDRTPPEYTTYPLAYCKGMGNCQASTHLQFYQAFVDRVNSAIQNAHQDAYVPPVQRGPHQMYNEIAHKTRARDGLHDSQRGHVTAAMSGKLVRGANLVAAHLRSQRTCEAQLPSQSYKEKLLRTGHYIGLRSEPTVTVNVQALPEDLQTGRFIYQDIMQVGCDLYSEQETWAELCDLLVVLKPLMWPGIMNWATRPVTAAIQALWEAHQSKAEGVGAEWDEVELVCLLERLLVFAQTGNARVIGGALSEAFGLKHSLETTGFPAFSSAFDPSLPTPTIRQGYWPTRGADNQAVTCANATLKYYYNEGVSQTHTAKATLGLMLQHAPVSSNSNPETQTAELLADHLVDVLLRDIKAYVVDQCSREIELLRARGSLEEKNHAGQRERYLDEWRGYRNPWGQGNPFKALIIAVAYGPRTHPALAPSQPGVLTTGDLASLIVDCMDPQENLRTSPLWVNNGAFKELALVVWEVASARLGLDGNELKVLMIHVVSASLTKRQVCRLPWVTVKPGGRLGRHIALVNWVTIQRPEEPNRRQHQLETPAMRQERQAAQIVVEAEDQDRTAPWMSFSGLLSNQRRYIHRSISPEDLDFESVIKSVQDPTMKAFLTRIASNFSIQTPSHRLGLRVASLASRLLPFVNLTIADNAQSGPSAERIIQNSMIWCQSTRKDASKGLMDREKWASTFTLAWLFYQSTPMTHEIFKSVAYSGFLKKLASARRHQQQSPGQWGRVWKGVDMYRIGRGRSAS